MSRRVEQTNDKCPVTFGLDIFGDKWSLLIVRDLLFKRKRYYGEFLDSAEKISTNILANRLQKLEQAEIVSKRRDPNNAKKYLYTLTAKGEELLPMLLELIAWSSRYDPQPNAPDSIIAGAPPNLLHRFRTDRDVLLEEIISNSRSVNQ